MTKETKAIEKRETAPMAGTDPTRESPRFVPRVDIFETDDQVVVVADMPGVDAGSVDITLERNILSITGYVDQERPEGYSLARSEYRDGDYQRHFTITDEIDRERIEAVVKDGVLHLHLPRAAKATTIKIAVKGS